MSNEMCSKMPDLNSPALRAMISEDNLDFYKYATPSEIQIAQRIEDVAKKIVPAMCDLEENQGKDGVVIAITKRSIGFPILTLQVGNVTDPDPKYRKDGKLGKYSDFADRKAFLLQIHREFIASSQNATLPEDRKMRSQNWDEIPGGAIAVGEWIISISAFKNPKMDTVTSIAIAVGARLLGIDEAEAMAHNPRVDCVDEFMKNEDKILTETILH